jgi:hypothetical protein
MGGSVKSGEGDMTLDVFGVAYGQFNLLLAKPIEEVNGGCEMYELIKL